MGKSYKLAVASFIFLILGTSGLFAQNTGTLSGIVRDNTGNPIPGAAVMNKDSGKGTITAEDGTFAISIPLNSRIVVSSLGYSEKELTIKNFSHIEIALDDDTQLLDEILVVGYGTQSRKTLTSSISKLEGGKLVDIPASTTP